MLKHTRNLRAFLTDPFYVLRRTTSTSTSFWKWGNKNIQWFDFVSVSKKLWDLKWELIFYFLYSKIYIIVHINHDLLPLRGMVKIIYLWGANIVIYSSNKR